MSDFQISKDKLPFIARKLRVKEDELKKFLPSFKEFYKVVRLQHLAHLMRAMELYVQEKTNNQTFKIVWCKMSDKNVTSAVSLKWNDKYGIVTPAKLNNDDDDDLRQLRVYVAHELGHLFFSTQHPEESKNDKLNQDMANIFGVFAMLERNEFYDKKVTKIRHNSWEDVVRDFVPFVP